MPWWMAISSLPRPGRDTRSGFGSSSRSWEPRLNPKRGETTGQFEEPLGKRGTDMKSIRDCHWACGGAVAMWVLAAATLADARDPSQFQWFPKAPPLPAANVPSAEGEVICVHSVDQLLVAAQRVKPGGTIRLAAGRVYAAATDRDQHRSSHTPRRLRPPRCGCLGRRPTTIGQAGIDRRLLGRNDRRLDHREHRAGTALRSTPIKAPPA